jgi:DNA modification methylase
VISRRQLPELTRFATVEEDLPIIEVPEFAKLVVPNGNAERAGHRWFKYKEAFSADLLLTLLERLAVPTARELVLLDPFCGVGTTLLSAQLASSRGYRFRTVGIECHPLAELITRTKLSWHEINVAKLRRLAGDALDATSHGTDTELPRLSSITTGRCISPTFARHIVRAREWIDSERSTPERDALRVALASTIEPLSKIRRDGRALRIVEKPRSQFKPVFSQRMEAIAQDVESLRKTYPAPPARSLHLGDGRDPKGVGIAHGTVDLIITSPPYPNNIDYNEVYKLELWLLGFATSPSNFLELRRKTYRSHPTCSAPDDDKTFVSAFQKVFTGPRLSPLMKMIANRVEHIEDEQRRGRAKVLLGYAFDTWRSLKAHYQALRAKGTAVYVVGNSLHGKEKPYLIPTDLLFARLAEEVGFTVQSLIIARSLQRRVAGNHFLRDSIVVLKKS